MSLESTPRPYRKQRRAEQEQQTRLRITDAAVKLHGTVGPARTTISAVAAEAGVQRATVYRHFPDEPALFAACSGRYWSQHPPPDLALLASLRDPDERLRVAVAGLYDWYAETEQMLERTSRDAHLVPAMADATAGFLSMLNAIRDALLSGRRERGRNRTRVGAAIGHALTFSTWQSLVRGQGLEPAAATELMVRFVAAGV